MCVGGGGGGEVCGAVTATASCMSIETLQIFKFSGGEGGGGG